MGSVFTGIVEELGAVKGLASNNLSVQAKTVLESTKIGDSIAVNGVCLTVTELGANHFAVEIMPETRKLTNMGLLRVGDRLNLERALPSQGRFGGHFVEGHVDATGKLVRLVPEGDAVVASVSAPSDVLRYIVRKGFIAVNGVSLTVIDYDAQQFSVSLVTHTRRNTNLGVLKKGDLVNLEADIIAKYIEKFYCPDKQESIINLLKKYDYLETR